MDAISKASPAKRTDKKAEIWWFWIRRDTVTDGHWKRIGNAGRAVLPIILAYRGKEFLAYPRQAFIAKIAGITEKTVRDGLNHLVDIPGVYEVEPRKVVKGYVRQFHVDPIQNENNAAFSVDRRILDSDIWANLKSVAKSLYITLLARSVGRKVDGERYPYVLCKASAQTLSRDSGISPRSFRTAVKSLEGARLLQAVQSADVKWVEQKMSWKVAVLIDAFDRPEPHGRPRIVEHEVVEKAEKTTELRSAR